MGPRPESMVGGAGFRRDIQGLRGVAVLLVVLFHVGVGPRAGFLGVDVFFVISGFVIGQRLFDELSGTGAMRLRSFYGRRIRRLLPAMSLFTVVTAIGSALLLSPFGPQQFALRTGAAATVLIGNVHLYRHTGYFDGSAERNPFLHTWSLSVEEQFYLVLPAMLALTWFALRRLRPGRSPAAPTAVIITLVAIWSFALSWALTSGRRSFGLEAPQRLAFFAMPTRIWEFAAGVLLVLALRRWRPPSAPVAGALGAVGLLAVLVAAVVLDPAAPHPAGWALVTVAGSALLICSGARPGTPVAALLSARPLVWLGDISYGWYLWHWPAIVFARVVWPGSTWVLAGAAVVSFVPTVLSYRLVERPVRYEPRWAGRRTVTLAVGCVAVPLVLIAGLNWGATQQWGLEEPAGWYDYPPGREAGCHLINRDAVNTPPGEECSVGPVDATGTVLVVGDENAESITPGVIDATIRAGLRSGERSGLQSELRTVQWSRAGCPFLDGRAPLHYPRCTEWQEAVYRLVAETQPDLVVIANQSVTHVESGAQFTAADGQPSRGADAEESLRAGLGGALDRLEVPVVVVHSIPDFGDSFPRRRLSVLNPEPGVPELSRSSVDRRRAEAMAVERAVTDSRLDAVAFDPVPALCAEVCRPRRAGEWLYLDANLLTNAGSRILSDDLARVIDDLLG